jgi:L-ascorbate metabolism protein UlaG (beta-lactamase superfamily)
VYIARKTKHVAKRRTLLSLWHTLDAAVLVIPYRIDAISTVDCTVFEENFVSSSHQEATPSAKHTKRAVMKPLLSSDSLVARNGETINFTFYRHASLAIAIGEKQIYLDPLTQYIDCATQAKADLILVSHFHYDHLDPLAIRALSTADTQCLCDETSAQQIEGRCHIMRPGAHYQVGEIEVEAVAAYNTSADRLQFHPKSRKDCGYVLTLGGTRIYLSGDGEPTPEMLALRDIDVAFLAVNQPYTMTIEQVVSVLQVMRPTHFYPYHYGEVEQPTDLEELTRRATPLTDIRLTTLA